MSLQIYAESARPKTGYAFLGIKERTNTLEHAIQSSDCAWRAWCCYEWTTRLR